MSLQNATEDVLPWVKAELNYLAPSPEKPRTYTYDPPVGVPRTTVVNDPHEVLIIDVRRIAADLTLDGEGFGLIQHKSAVRDFYDDAEVERIYYPESSRTPERPDRSRPCSHLRPYRAPPRGGRRRSTG